MTRLSPPYHIPLPHPSTLHGKGGDAAGREPSVFDAAAWDPEFRRVGDGLVWLQVNSITNEIMVGLP